MDELTFKGSQFLSEIASTLCDLSGHKFILSFFGMIFCTILKIRPLMCCLRCLYRIIMAVSTCVWYSSQCCSVDSAKVVLNIRFCLFIRVKISASSSSSKIKSFQNSMPGIWWLKYCFDILLCMEVMPENFSSRQRWLNPGVTTCYVYTLESSQAVCTWTFICAVIILSLHIVLVFDCKDAQVFYS